MSLIDDTCDTCGGRFDPMGDPLLTKRPDIGPYAVSCATCESKRKFPVTPDTPDLADELAGLHVEGWRLESEHDPGCSGDEGYCMSNCPVPVQVRIGPDEIAAVVASRVAAVTAERDEARAVVERVESVLARWSRGHGIIARCYAAPVRAALAPASTSEEEA